MKHVTTTAYHPQSNGMVERVHRHLKEGLKARGAAADWPQHLPWVLLNIRTALKSDSNISAAEMVYGAALTLPAQPAATEETPTAAVDQQRAGKAIPTRPTLLPPPTDVPRHLATAEMVYVRKGGQPGPLAPPYSGPYSVVTRTPRYFTIDIGGQEQPSQWTASSRTQGQQQPHQQHRRAGGVPRRRQQPQHLPPRHRRPEPPHQAYRLPPAPDQRGRDDHQPN